jgi:hypothetical protein
MTLPTHRVSYEVEYGILDKAVNDEVGARIKLPSLDAAVHLRARIHQARKIDRDENKNAFNEGHPMHGQSIYDKLVCRIKQFDGRAYLYIEQRNAENLEIETLSEPEQPPMEVHEVLVAEVIKRRKF